MKGIIEGFYGVPWTWEDRREIAAALHSAGMDTYVYAPKDDPLHRARWREPYPAAELEQFAAFARDDTLRVGFSISPGLSIDVEDPADRAALLAKYRQLTDVGVSLVGVLFDDLDPGPDLGARHGSLTAWLRDQLDDSVELFMVPLHYTGCERSQYLDQLLETVPVGVPIGWTGRHVVNRRISVGDARAWRAAMDGRRPLLWDNSPVNDAIMVDHLFTGPLRGREPGLERELSGYLANPMVQPRASLPALLSAAAWLRGEDPERAWQDSLGEDRIVLEGCDGAVPSALADAALAGDDAAAASLEEWFGAAEHCGIGGLDESVQPWVDQLRAEAAVGKVAVGLLRGGLDEARRVAPLLYVMWPPVRTARPQVLGGRGAMLPCMGQDAASRWVASGESYLAPASVIDRLVAAVFERLG